MFPPIARASLFDRCLDPLWVEMGVDVPQDYQDFLRSTVNEYTKNNPNKCKEYMEAANAELLNEALPLLLDSDGQYQTPLLTAFYSRISARIATKIRKRKIKPADYFNLDDHKLVTDNQRIMDILNAILEEIDEATKIHDALSLRNILQNIDEADIKACKYDYTWFKDVNSDIFLEVADVVVDTADKGSSAVNRGMQAHKMIQLLAGTPQEAHPAKPIDGPKPYMPSTFQIAGIVISFCYLIISILTPLYKKYKLKRPDPIINRWSLRYFIPSVLLFALGLVALTVPVVGVFAGFVFAGYSLASNIFKVIMYFYYHKELTQELAENRINIARLEDRLSKLPAEIEKLKTKYKLLSLSAAPDTAKACANDILRLEQEYQQVTAELLLAECDREELEVKKIRTHDKLTGVLNILRLATVCLGLAGTILAFIPPTAPIGCFILLATFCLSTALLYTHYVNKFLLIREEKSLAKAKKAEFTPVPGRNSPALIKKGLESTKSKLRLQTAPKLDATKEVPGISLKGGVLKGIFQMPHEHVKAAHNPEAGSVFSI